MNKINFDNNIRTSSENKESKIPAGSKDIENFEDALNSKKPMSSEEKPEQKPRDEGQKRVLQVSEKLQAPQTSNTESQNNFSSLQSSMLNNLMGNNTSNNTITNATSSANTQETSNLINNLVNKILVSTQSGGKEEVRLILNDNILKGTEISIKSGSDGLLQINFTTNNANSFQTLVANQSMLKEALERTNENVSVNISQENNDSDRESRNKQEYYNEDN